MTRPFIVSGVHVWLIDAAEELDCRQNLKSHQLVAAGVLGACVMPTDYRCDDALDQQEGSEQHGDGNESGHGEGLNLGADDDEVACSFSGEIVVPEEDIAPVAVGAKHGGVDQDVLGLDVAG